MSPLNGQINAKQHTTCFNCCLGFLHSGLSGAAFGCGDKTPTLVIFAELLDNAYIAHSPFWGMQHPLSAHMPKALHGKEKFTLDIKKHE